MVGLTLPYIIIKSKPQTLKQLQTPTREEAVSAFPAMLGMVRFRPATAPGEGSKFFQKQRIIV